MSGGTARPAGPRLVALALSVLLMHILTGSLGSPFGSDEVPFEAVQRAHFDAIAVQHASGGPSDAPLVLRLNILGERDHASVEEAARWLRAEFDVVLVEDARGAPLYLTSSDLSATSGRATLGATLRTGMAVEVRNPSVAPCVVAHEALHFLGLRHSQDDDNIMGPHCTPDKLDHATVTREQVDAVARLDSIRALTPRGVQTWAERAS